MDKFVIGGVTFNWEAERDGGMGHPWEEHDGHGVIRGIYGHSRPSKRPSEVVIYSDRGSHWLYDVAATTKLAAEDGWGLGDDALQSLEKKLGRAPTKKEITAQAVRNDMDFCRKYLNDQICWFSVTCWAEDASDDKEYLGGILCEYGDDYLEEAAKGLAGELLHQRKAKEAELDLVMEGL